MAARSTYRLASSMAPPYYQASIQAVNDPDDFIHRLIIESDVYCAISPDAFDARFSRTSMKKRCEFRLSHSSLPPHTIECQGAQ
jgi:hypothetical protein